MFAQTLTARIRHMERLMQLKDERLDEMTRQMDRLTQMLTANNVSSLSSPHRRTTVASSSSGCTSPAGVGAIHNDDGHMNTSLIDI
jgi:hypothetical protein